MEMVSSFRGVKNEFCLHVIKFKHVRLYMMYDIYYIHDVWTYVICIAYLHSVVTHPALSLYDV